MTHIDIGAAVGCAGATTVQGGRESSAQLLNPRPSSFERGEWGQLSHIAHLLLWPGPSWGRGVSLLLLVPYCHCRAGGEAGSWVSKRTGFSSATVHPCCSWVSD
jgi:hypothetical protein